MSMSMSSCPDNQANKKPGAPEHFSDLVGSVINNMAGKGRLGAEEIASAWSSAAGAAAARHSRPVSFKKNSLIVNVESSSWLYELTVRKKEILQILEKELKGGKVKELRFRIGEIKEAK